MDQRLKPLRYGSFSIQKLPSGAKLAAEKVRIGAKSEPQGLKPNVLSAIYGTTKVVP